MSPIRECGFLKCSLTESEFSLYIKLFELLKSFLIPYFSLIINKLLPTLVMEVTIGLLLLPLLLLPAMYIYITSTSDASIPTVAFNEYLPNGLVYMMLTNTRYTFENLTKLSKKYGDVYQFWLGPTHTIVTSVPGDIAHVLTTVRQFDRPKAMLCIFQKIIPNSFFTLPSNIHQRIRKKLRESFNHSLLANFHERLAAAIDEVTVDLTEKTPRCHMPDGYSDIFDVSKVLSTLTLRSIVNVAFGANWDRQKRMQVNLLSGDLLDSILVEVYGYPYRTWLKAFGYENRAEKLGKKMREVCDNLVQARRQESDVAKLKRPRDVLDAILESGEEEDSDTVSPTSQALIFLIAGSDTTNHSLCWLLYEVLQRPHIVSNIEEEIVKVLSEKEETGQPNCAIAHEDVSKLVYINKVWKETLRMHPPGGAILREATTNLKLRTSQKQVRKGGAVIALIQRSQTHEAYWDAAEDFIPERWESPAAGAVPAGAYLPFSAGVRSCAGQMFADYESILVAANLFHKFSFKLACEPEEIQATSSWVSVARYSSKGDGNYDMGLPLRLRVKQMLAQKAS